MKQDWRPVTMVTQVGLTIVVSILIGLAIGMWVDGVFGTKPCATLLLALAGIAAGSVGVYRLVAQAIDQAAGPSPQNKGNHRKEEDEK